VDSECTQSCIENGWSQWNLDEDSCGPSRDVVRMDGVSGVWTRILVAHLQLWSEWMESVEYGRGFLWSIQSCSENGWSQWSLDEDSCGPSKTAVKMDGVSEIWTETVFGVPTEFATQPKVSQFAPINEVVKCDYI
jgi:hypothetical protein